MCCARGINIRSSEPQYFRFSSQQLLTCFTWSDALYLELIEWSAPAAYYKTSLLLMKKTNIGEKQSYCSLSKARAQSDLVQGDKPGSVQEWGSYLGAEKGRNTPCSATDCPQHNPENLECSDIKIWSMKINMSSLLLYSLLEILVGRFCQRITSVSLTSVISAHMPR